MPGSSPLARGLLRAAQKNYDRFRIIPARAGFTIQFRQVASQSRDHPRSRGVYVRAERIEDDEKGSSPLARGLRGDSGVRRPEERIIPARAGFTSGSLFLRCSSTDHPRSRGVYTCGSLESQRTRTLPDPCCLHCRPRVRSAELR